MENHTLFSVGPKQKSFGCKAYLKFNKVVEGKSLVELFWSHNHDLSCFASTSRRDPADFVKSWFAGEYAKGVPAMRALRRYIDHLFTFSNVPSRTLVRVIADRLVVIYIHIYCINVRLHQQVRAIDKGCLELVSSA